jgi:hypothetical protein
VRKAWELMARIEPQGYVVQRLVLQYKLRGGEQGVPGNGRLGRRQQPLRRVFPQLHAIPTAPVFGWAGGTQCGNGRAALTTLQASTTGTTTPSR